MQTAHRMLNSILLIALISALPDQQHLTLQPPLTFERIGLEDGLPQSHVLAIAEDRLGFLWFGTQEGLARYSGIGVQVFRSDLDDTGSISSSFITALVADENSLWIGTGEGGLNRYDLAMGSFTSYRHRPDDETTLPSDGITAMLKSRGGDVWIGTEDGSLTRLDPTTALFTRTVKPENINSGAEFSVTALAEDPTGLVWIGTSGAGLLRFDPQSSSLEQFRHEQDANSLASNEVTALLFDRRGELWVGTRGGLNRFDPASKRFEIFRSVAEDPSTLSNDSITMVFEDDGGRLWVGTENGVNRFDRKTSRSVRFVADAANPESLSYPKAVTTAFQDSSGMVWFGTFAQGVRSFDGLRIAFHHHSLLNSTVNSFLEDRDGTLWIGTYDRGLFHLDRKKGVATLYRRLGGEDGVALDSHWLTTLHRDRRGALWIGTADLGVLRVDQATGAHQTFGNGKGGLAASRVDRIVEARDGTLWMATWGNGLVAFNPKTETFTAFTSDEADEDSISSDYLYTVLADVKQPSVLWLGTTGGLTRFDTHTRSAVRHTHTPGAQNSLGHDSVSSLHQDPDGTLWIGTYGGGLTRYSDADQTFERFPKGSGLDQGAIYGIARDSRDRLWMSTNGRGLLVLDTKTRHISSFDARDGLQGDEFAQGAAYQTKSGELLFGGLDGFNVFRPEQIDRDTKPPRVVLTNLKLFSGEARLPRPIWNLPVIDLAYDESVFSIEFAALSFASPKRNRYRYQLEGFRDEWIETDRPVATYTNLDGGNYVFHVRAANRHGVWTAASLALPIHIDPPPWARWWAYALYGAALLACVLAYMRYHAGKLEELRRATRLMTVERDLDLTAAVQTGLLPQAHAVTEPDFRLVGFYRAADRCSGDWWWHEPLGGGRHAILVGDVTGHGAAPAVVTAAVATAFRVQSILRPDPMPERLRVLNDQVYQVGRGRYFMTMSVIELDTTTGLLVLYSAGGLPVVRLGADHLPKIISCRGNPLGMDDFSIGRVEVQLSPGERLMICTDGLSELATEGGGMLGMRGLSRIFGATKELPLDGGVDHIIGSVDAMRQTREQEDDWTLVLVQWQ